MLSGDQHNDLVEAFLRAGPAPPLLREPAQQHARTAERATNHVRSWAAVQRPRCRQPVSSDPPGSGPAANVYFLGPYSECGAPGASLASGHPYGRPITRVSSGNPAQAVRKTSLSTSRVVEVADSRAGRKVEARDLPCRARAPEEAS